MVSIGYRMCPKALEAQQEPHAEEAVHAGEAPGSGREASAASLCPGCSRSAHSAARDGLPRLCDKPGDHVLTGHGAALFLCSTHRKGQGSTPILQLRKLRL